MRFRSSNLVFKKLFGVDRDLSYETCTYKGIAGKTIFFLLMTVLGAALGIGLLQFAPNALVVLLALSGILTLVFSIVAMCFPRQSKVFGSLYCIFEGMLVGLVSMLCMSLIGGAVSIALLSTIAVFAVVTLLYTGNVVKVNGKFMRFLTIFAISFIVGCLVMAIFSLFTEINFGLTLLLNAITIFLASLYLFFDLENIREVVEGEYPKMYEWFAAFGLAFTLIWLYVEILQLVIRIADRN